MKNIIIASLLLVSFSLTAQIDTTIQIDISQNVSRESVQKSFGEYVYEYRVDNELSYITLSSWFSVIATNIHGYNVEFTTTDIKNMEKNNFLPFPKVQNQIILYIKNQNQ